MKARTKRCLELLDRVSQFFREQPTLIFGPRGTVLVGDVDMTADAMRCQGAGQVSGFGEFRGAVAERRDLAAELLVQIREIELVAKSMPPETAPVPAEQLRRPQLRSHQALLDTAAAFVSVLTPMPVQQAFIDRDFPADFVSQLSTLVAQFKTATGRKYAGRQTQKGGTLGVDQSAKKALAIVKELNAIVTKKLRTTDPVVLGVWKAASRLEQPPKRMKDTSASLVPASAGNDEASLVEERDRVDRDSQDTYDEYEAVLQADAKPNSVTELSNEKRLEVAKHAAVRKPIQFGVPIRRADLSVYAGSGGDSLIDDHLLHRTHPEGPRERSPVLRALDQANGRTVDGGRSSTPADD
jgi:hypothetical protein